MPEFPTQSDAFHGLKDRKHQINRLAKRTSSFSFEIILKLPIQTFPFLNSSVTLAVSTCKVSIRDSFNFASDTISSHPNSKPLQLISMTWLIKKLL